MYPFQSTAALQMQQRIFVSLVFETDMKLNSLAIRDLRFSQRYCSRFNSRFLYCIKCTTRIIAWRDAFGTMNTTVESNPDIAPLYVYRNLGRHIEGDVKFECRKIGSLFLQTFMGDKPGWHNFGVWLHVHDMSCAHNHNAIKIFFIHFTNCGLICCISVNWSNFCLFRKIPFSSPITASITGP